MENTDYQLLEETEQHNIKICTCTQCKAAKKHLTSKARKYFKRLINKKRRKGKKGKTTNFYYA